MTWRTRGGSVGLRGSSGINWTSQPASQQTQATCGVTIKERWDDGENDHQDGDKNEKPHIDFSSHLWRILIIAIMIPPQFPTFGELASTSWGGAYHCKDRNTKTTFYEYSTHRGYTWSLCCTSKWYKKCVGQFNSLSLMTPRSWMCFLFKWPRALTKIDRSALLNMEWSQSQFLACWRIHVSAREEWGRSL